MNICRNAATWLMTVGLIALPSTAIAATPVPGQPAELSVGQPAPDFNLTLFSGKKVTLKSFLGKAVIVNFWRAG